MTNTNFSLAKAHFQDSGEVSIASLQRRFRIGHSDAKSMMSELKSDGLVTKPLPEGFRVLSAQHENLTKPEAPSDFQRYARSVFETALYLVETRISKRGAGRSDTLDEIKPLNIVDRRVFQKVLPRIDSVITSSIEINETNLLTVCRWVADLEGEGCIAPPYSYTQIEEALSDKCAWWARTNQWVVDDPIEERYSIGLMACARYLHRIFGEGASMGGGHSRIELFVRQELRAFGRSKKWDEQLKLDPAVRAKMQLEHVVPCALIRDNSIRLYGLGASIRQVASYIDRHFVTVQMLQSESTALDTAVSKGGYGLKTTMPDGWKVGVDSIFARLRFAGIEFTAPAWFKDND